MNDNNKPSWLRGPLLEEEVKDSVNINSSPQSVQKNEEKLGPSWLHENSIEEGKLINEQSVKKEAKKAKSNAKWKQAPQSTGEEEEDCCCCPSDPVLFGFRCFHVASGLTGIAAFSANVYTYSSPNLQIKDAIVRTYALFFCALIVLVELDWRFVVSRVKFMDLWVFRGFFYTFVGLLTFGVADGDEPVSATPQDIIGLILGAFGFCYIIMGICCIKSMQNRRRHKYVELTDNEDNSLE